MKLTQAPVLPLRDEVVFPGIITSLTLRRIGSVKALKASQLDDNLIVIVTQRENTEEVEVSKLCSVGTLAQIMQVIALPDGSFKLMVRAIERVDVNMFVESDGYLQARAFPLVEETVSKDDMSTYRGLLLRVFEDFREVIDIIPEGVTERASELEDVQIPDFLASHIPLKLDLKIELLECKNPVERAKKLFNHLAKELCMVKMDRDLRERVEQSFTNRHKEQYLREQMKVIQEELGGDNADDLIKAAKESGMPEGALEKTLKEIDRYQAMSDYSPEATVCRTWLDWAIGMPWVNSDEEKHSLADARRILDETHWGLEKVKDRLVEFLAQKSLAQEDCPAQILCLVGPPGVGKTSLGRTVAQALGRKFVSFSMGGMRDESEIRGHRRTYIGSRPGRIIQKIKESGVNNPVMLLDEVDKLGSDFRGDPASALLEALDPEQNSAFTDHYLELPFDLSKVVFITTANMTHTIPRPLLDRMEVIRLSGYLPEEKVNIAREHLLPRLYKEHGLSPRDLEIKDSIILDVITHYTRESGVRELKRQLAKLFRSRAVEVLTNLEESGKRPRKKSVSKAQLAKLLGAPRHVDSGIPKKDAIGYSTGLAWTETGGEVLPIEVAVIKGKGQLILTGNLGDVMKESAQAALSFLRSKWSKITRSKEPEWNQIELHFHAPEGAIPKDGPSAGLAIATAMLSALTNKPYDVSYGMTGEINLRGDALPIGGLKEKLLAAKRYGLKKVLIPQANMPDLADIDSWLIEGIDVTTVKDAYQVFKHTLGEKK